MAEYPNNLPSYVYPRSLWRWLAQCRRGNAHSLEELVPCPLLTGQGIDMDDAILRRDALLVKYEIVDILVR